MNKKVVVCLCMAFVICIALTAVSNAADENKGNQAKNFWQKLFNYPANVTKESVNVVAETAKRGTAVVTDEVKTVGQVTSGDTEKGGALVTEPVKGTADTVAKAVEETAKIPTEANKAEATK
ncbi:MAG: hypothetical protein NTY76_03655 [Candidatus Omnitrophica bacterium]|nr:hypothetical protein [Candidatus Omnitrophota bacterium]